MRAGEKFSIDGIRCVLAYLGNPERVFPTVHIGGTNGKGSVSATISSIAGAAGKRVGLTISPHLSRLNERIVIDGQSVSDSRLDDALCGVIRGAKRLGLELSYFEYMIAAAFLIFAEEAVELGVIEVGLGGRLDATNVLIRPEAVGIVSVGLDHTEILGDSEQQIAVEKSRIIKRGVPVVIGEMSEPPRRAIVEYADECHAPTFISGTDFISRSLGDDRCRYEENGGWVNDFHLGLLGPHQVRNAGVAIKLSRLIGLDEVAIQHGLSHVFWPGRFERVRVSDRTVIFDCAHNPDGICALSDSVKAYGLQPVDIAFAALNNRDWRSMIHRLLPLTRDWCILEAVTEKAVPAGEIGDYLSGLGIKVSVIGRDFSAFGEWIRMSHDDVPLVVTGSMYMVGPVRAALGVPHRSLWQRQQRQ